MSRKYKSRRPATTKEAYLDDISYFSHQAITTSTLNGRTLIGTVSVPTTGGVKAIVGSEQLVDRHTVAIINDTSFLIFVGKTPDATPDQQILIPSGVSIEININPSSPTDIYLFSPYYALDVKIIEVA